MTGRLLALTVACFALSAVPAGAVVGGVPADQRYPWMASLQFEDNHICGGSLVARDTVLTAAHCVQDADPADFSVVLGRTKLSSSAGERIGVKSIDVHAAFATDPDGGHDVALVRLARPSTAETIDLVDLEQRELWAPGKPVRVIGWGSSVFLAGPGSDDLMQADVEVIADHDCAASYDGAIDYGFDPATMFCAGEQIVGLEDACQGDSGGPLVAPTPGGFVQVGSVSSGVGCGFPLFYGVYARLGGPVLHGWLDRRLESSGDRVDTPVASPSEVRLKVRRARVRRGRLRVRIRVSAPVTGVKATLRKRGRTLGRDRVRSVERRRTLRIDVRRKRPRRARLRIVATDAGGDLVRTVRRVSLRR